MLEAEFIVLGAIAFACFLIAVLHNNRIIPIVSVLTSLTAALASLNIERASTAWSETAGEFVTHVSTHSEPVMAWVFFLMFFISVIIELVELFSTPKEVM